MIKPDYQISYKKLLPFSNIHGEKYNFYSGEDSGIYAKIGGAITRDAANQRHTGTIGLFDDQDTLENISSSGGYENFMKVTSQNNSFSLVQNAVIKLQDDQLLKSVNIVTPLFEERLHIFYRKDLFNSSSCKNIISPQISANSDPRILNCFFRSVKNIQIGKIGSCTRIIAGDVLDLIERQIQQNRGNNSFRVPYRLLDESLADAFKSIREYHGPFKRMKNSNDNVLDIVFFVGADPTEDVRSILEANQYGLMSVSQSFLSRLNTEFKMNLQVADFQKKYPGAAEHVSTVGTFTSLIASRDIGTDDVNRMLKKISDATKVIQKSLIVLPPSCTDSCYSGFTANCPYILPLAEFGFYKYVRDQTRESNIEMIKTIIPFLIAIISFFFPILKSVGALNSLWRSWQINQEIDRILFKKRELSDDDMLDLNRQMADLYGDGELSEAHYNALVKRISAHGHAPTESEEDNSGKGFSNHSLHSILPSETLA
jgi:TRAP-type uncharacterized transport system substrate-binding protein